MKTKATIGLLSTLLASIIVIGMAGCASTPPSKFESSIFDIKTNYIPTITFQTNTVWRTNVEVQTITVTNPVGVVVPQYVTNFIPVATPVVTQVSNAVPAYDYQQGAAAEQMKQSAATIGNLIAPGIGGPIAYFGLGLILTGLGWFRSSKRANTLAGNFGQVVETARELLKTIPDGQKYDAALVQWMQQHQAEEGVLQSVLGLLRDRVNNADAQIAARQIADTIAALKK